MKINKTITDASGSSMRVEKILTIDVKPGYKAGTKITFSQEGDESPGRIAADIIFVLQDKPHQWFRRTKTELIFKCPVGLKEALTGTVVTIPHLSGQTLQVAVPEVIVPGYTKRVPGKGMPLSKQPGQFTDLILEFDVQFPQHLTDAQKAQLRSIL